MPRRRSAALAGALIALLAIAGCDAGAKATGRARDLAVSSSVSAAVSPSRSSSPPLTPAPSPPASSSPPPPGSASSTTTSPTPRPSPQRASSAPTAAAPAAPPFTASVRTVTAADLGASWHQGCPVDPEQLREISLSYWGFDNAAHTGRIVVNANAVTAIETAFKTLYTERFPVRGIRPVSEFGGSDDASMAADNTSAFNCRNAVAQGAPRWSAHAYGEAVDVNTVENPYLEGGQVLPPQGAPFAKRSPYRAGMAVPGGQLVKAFAAVGWQWGGRWIGSPDYQHFSSTGG